LPYWVELGKVGPDIVGVTIVTMAGKPAVNTPSMLVFLERGPQSAQPRGR
jgi:hypothetical protein